MSLRAGLALSGMSEEELWWRHLGLGGSLSLAGLRAALRGARTLSWFEHDVLAQGLNDHFTERGQNHPVAYADEIEVGADEPR